MRRYSSLTPRAAAHSPLVAPDGIVYSFCGYQHNGGYIPEGSLLGWKIDTPYMMYVGHNKAIDEPVAAAGGGNLIYMSSAATGAVNPST